MDKKFLSEIVLTFSKSVIEICQQLDYMNKQIISRQLLRSATAIGAASAEARDAESADDFIHKLKIARKEANETKYWLDLVEDMVMVPQETKDELTSIQKILATSINTATKRKQTNKPRR